MHSHYRGVASSWHDLNHSVCSVFPATAKQKGIHSANSTEQSQHRATHSPARIKWAIFKNTPYKGLSRHQQKLQLCLDPAFHFQNGFLWAYMAKIWWLFVQCTYPCLLAWAAFPCSYWQKNFITLKARPPVPIWAFCSLLSQQFHFPSIKKSSQLHKQSISYSCIWSWSRVCIKQRYP